MIKARSYAADAGRVRVYRHDQRLTLERLAVVLVALATGCAMVWFATGSVSVYLSPDGAHAITDARALMGDAPRSYYYLPAWPALLTALLALGVDPLVAIHVALAALCVMLAVALYALVRHWASFGSSLIGAIVGAASTPIGELLGWQGGATLFALVALCASLAAFEEWALRRRAQEALLTGSLFTLCAAAHPFVAVTGALLLLVRWLVELGPARAHWNGWGPTSGVGIVVGSTVLVAALPFLLPRYLAIQAPTGSVLRVPDLGTTFSVLQWVTRESPVLLVLLGLVCAAALAGPRSCRAIAGSTLAIFVALPAFLSGDASYQSRVAYLLPIVLASGATMIVSGLGDWPFRAGSIRQFERALPAGAALLILSVTSLTLFSRLSAAVPYYSPLNASDARLLTSLERSRGTILTSWTENRYFGGLAASWLVEGLANQAAIGPTDPALSTRQIEINDGSAAWELFSGAAGLQNGALQVAVGPQGWRADPAIAANILGAYTPLVSISDAVNDYGTPSVSSERSQWTVGDGIATSTRTADGRQVMRETVALDGTHVSIRWSRTGADSHPWTVWLWPAYGLPWSDAAADGDAHSLQLSPLGTYATLDPTRWARRNPRILVTVASPTTLQFVASEARYHVQAVQVSAPPGADIALSVDVLGTLSAGSVRSYDERAVIDQNHIGAAVVWRDTGWTDRFSTSPCWQAVGGDDTIALYQVRSTCER